MPAVSRRKTKLCGATTKSGRACRIKAGEDGRCRWHRESSSDSAAALAPDQTHGIYSTALSPEDKADWERVPLNDLEDEIKLVTFSIRRILAQLREQQDSKLEPVLEKLVMRKARLIEIRDRLLFKKADEDDGREAVQSAKQELSDRLDRIAARLRANRVDRGDDRE